MHNAVRTLRQLQSLNGTPVRRRPKCPEESLSPTALTDQEKQLKALKALHRVTVASQSLLKSSSEGAPSPL